MRRVLGYPDSAGQSQSGMWEYWTYAGITYDERTGRVDRNVTVEIGWVLVDHTQIVASIEFMGP